MTDMKKNISRYLTLASALLLMTSCGESESDLLTPKVYFESAEHRVTIDGEEDYVDVDLVARWSNETDKQASLSYIIDDSSAVNEYNAKYGTDYVAFKPEDAKLQANGTVIESGKIYANKVQMRLSGLKTLEEGKSYILPVRVTSPDAPVISGGDRQYIILSKPIHITKVGTFNNSYINVKFPTGTYFKSFTYEALIYANSFYSSSHTIMGNEGIMILRVGDTGGGIASNILQIAGSQHYEAPQALQPQRWYHVAVTYDQSTGKTVMYVNGSKWAESAWNLQGFDPNQGVSFMIGRIKGFQWGERPFSGYMSEVRVWSVARTENQIKQNMLGVKPNTDGLELYYKFNGTETTEPGSIYDSAKHIQGLTGGITIKKLAAPVSVQ